MVVRPGQTLPMLVDEAARAVDALGVAPMATAHSRSSQRPRSRTSFRSSAFPPAPATISLDLGASIATM
jgi:hypothetical protein